MRVICHRCRQLIGFLPGLLASLGRGRPLDELRQKHLNCIPKENPT